MCSVFEGPCFSHCRRRAHQNRGTDLLWWITESRAYRRPDIQTACFRMSSFVDGREVVDRARHPPAEGPALPERERRPWHPEPRGGRHQDEVHLPSCASLEALFRKRTKSRASRCGLGLGTPRDAIVAILPQEGSDRQMTPFCRSSIAEVSRAVLVEKRGVLYLNNR